MNELETVGDGTGRSRRSFPRKSVLLCGRFYYGREAVDCVVTNISANGARLLVGKRVDRDAVGALNINRCGMFPAVVVWQGGEQTGLRFFDRLDRIASLMAGSLPHCRLEVAPAPA